MGERRAGLSGAALSVWAKYDHETEGWLPLHQHMIDSADVAAVLWDEWLPGNVRKVIADVFGGVAAGRRMFVWLAGVHDIGKASPTFAEKAGPLTARMVHHGLSLLPGRNTEHGQHWTIGQVVLSEWLQERYGYQTATAEALGCVLGGHHGNPPTARQLEVFTDARWRLGGSAWQAAREELLTWFTQRSNVTHLLPALADTTVTQPIQVLLSAGVIVADWIASNTDYFPLVGSAGGIRPGRAERGWAAIGLPPRWEPPEPVRDAESLLQQRFPFLTRARPLQMAVIDEAWRAPVPSLILVEAPMGVGKTEAALGAAEVLAHRFDCGGVVVALPTMATTDAMFGRVKDWIEQLPDGGALTTFLAHSKAGLNDDYTSMPTDASIAGLYDDDVADGRRGAVAVAHSWLRGRKKGVLATFVVATIDQVLFGALKSRHLALRHLALVGKVVIVDEVHAADDYMRTYLVRVLHWLGAYHVPVILLSATLPPAQREELVTAYESGLTAPVRRPLEDLDDLYS